MSAAAPALVTSPTPPALPELRLYRPRPGDPDWTRLAAEARHLAEEIGPRLARPGRGVSEWRRRWASYATAARNYVANRRLSRQGREDLRPLYFIWTMLRSCNFRCNYCDDHQGKRYPELSREGTLDTERGRELLRIMRSRTPSVYFAGGEPTLRADLPVLARAARDLCYYPVVINTNGSLLHRQLARPDWSTLLADLDIVVVSLDGLSPDVLASMWAYRRPLDVLRNLLLLRHLAGPLRFKLMVNTVIQPGQIDEARAVLDLANDLGIWYCPVPQNVGPAIHPALPDDPAYLALVDTILERQRRGYRISGSPRLNRRLLLAAPLACRNSLKPHVDHDGRLFWPCKAAVNVQPERIDVLAFADVEALYTHAVTRVEPTRFHGPARDQCGANCNWAQNYTTDAYAYGLRHPGSLIADVLGFLRPR